MSERAKQLVRSRLKGDALAWFESECQTLGAGVTSVLFSASLSKASRHAKDSRMLAATAEECAAFAELCPGLVIERWTLLEAVRIALILSLAGLDTEAGAATIEDAFRYADEGELRALYRSLALLPARERFLWRAAEGCRTNMQGVFEANVLDTPYPAAHFDAVAWRQAVVKCLFTQAPLWRLVGLDSRLDEDIACMVLDLAEERTSAGRPVYPELWACVAEGTSAGGEAERAKTTLMAQYRETSVVPKGRAGAAVGLVRAGHGAWLAEQLATESDGFVAAAAHNALAGQHDQTVFAAFRDEA